MKATNEAPELDVLLRQYKVAFPDAVSPLANSMSFGPEHLCYILREAKGREIVWSYPDQAEGVLDGCVFHYKVAGPSAQS